MSGNNTGACCSALDVIPIELGRTAPASGSCAIPSEIQAELTRSKQDPEEIPRVSTSLGIRDISGAWKARWAVNRMNYRVEPGLYRVGNPQPESPVLVSANYKFSFDMLRKELKGLDAWLLVLDTRGVNVWCAAGKGTFGTDELVRRIAVTGLDQMVSHRRVIIPQLGAPGVAAHQVKARSGFRVVYGPVRARDLPAFLRAGMKATPEMRRVEFSVRDRLAVAPVEIVHLGKPVIIIAFLLFLAHKAGWLAVSWETLYPFVGAALAGTLITPLLLPWIPGPAFAWKGGLVGLAWAALVIGSGEMPGPPEGLWMAAAYLLLLPAISGFLAMNFTGASTYTSLSGVRKEMKYAVPLLALMVAGGTLAGLAALAF